jgi:hypothetical protein
MYFIVETEEQLAQLPKVDKCFIELMSLSEHTHPSLSSPCVLYYNDFQKGYIIPINHSEGFSIKIQSIENLLKTIPKVYLLDKKWHSYYFDLPNSIDVYFTILDREGQIKDLQCYTTIHLDYYEKFKFSSNVNDYIPISKHYERCECMFEAVKDYVGLESNTEWQNKYVEVYKWVEEQGILIDEKLFDKYFETPWKGRSIGNSKVYSSYNLYNITSRPTNAFNSINFLAFNKENSSRTAFIPENDAFVEFDFDGYHLRLIANKMGTEIPQDESIHEYLGKQYFEKNELTPEEYQEAKKITFRQMYNGVEEEFKHIEFFEDVAIAVDAMWTTYKSNGFLELPNRRRITLENANPQKLFNYYIQCLETVNNVKKLDKLKKYLKDKQSRVLLVVYDSILIDYAASDGKGTLHHIKEILEAEGFKVKAKKGLNYDFSH